MKHKKSVVATLSLISQLGISMIVPVFLCIFVGIKLEEKFGVALTIPFIILGILAVSDMKKCLGIMLRYMLALCSGMCISATTG